MDAEQTLRNVPLFQELSDKQVRNLSRWATSRTYPTGQAIVSQGQSGLGLYCIQSGKVKVTQTTNDGERQVREMGPGESFGELALLDSVPRSATVTAEEPTTCVLLDKSQFLAELRSHPEMALSLLPVLTHWLREADAKIAALS